MSDEINQTKKDDCCSTCRQAFSWILQLGLLAQIILMILSLTFVIKYTIAYVITVSITYLIYVIFELCSSTFSYLINISESQGIHTTMKKLFETPIRIIFNVTCYHYEWRTHYNGKKRTTTREKVVTFVGSRDFVYYSWLDVSGHFLLDTNEAIRNDEILFIKLRLDDSYEMYDQFTNMDLNVQRNQYFNENRYRDVYMDTSTTSQLPGKDEFNLVKISEKETPFFFGKCWFLLFTFIIPVAQFYKYYISYYCSNQYFEIKKLLSTRINLNDPNIKSQYMDKGPKITFKNNETNYFKENVLIHNDPPLPNEGDLQVNENNREWRDNNELNEEDRKMSMDMSEEEVKKVKWDHGNNKENKYDNKW